MLADALAGGGPAGVVDAPKADVVDGLFGVKEPKSPPDFDWPACSPDELLSGVL